MACKCIVWPGSVFINLYVWTVIKSRIWTPDLPERYGPTDRRRRCAHGVVVITIQSAVARHRRKHVFRCDKSDTRFLFDRYRDSCRIRFDRGVFDLRLECSELRKINSTNDHSEDIILLYYVSIIFKEAIPWYYKIIKNSLLFLGWNLIKYLRFFFLGTLLSRLIKYQRNPLFIARSWTK